MTVEPILNDDDLKKTFRRLEKIFQAEEGTAQADERDVLVALVETYESRNCDCGQPTRARPPQSSRPDARPAARPSRDRTARRR